jgi:hypothetical protein
MRQNIKDIVDTLKAKGSDQKCSLLIGAGCSVEAGIPLAANIVDDIKKKHLQRYTSSSGLSAWQRRRPFAPVPVSSAWKAFLRFEFTFDDK